MGQIIYFGYKRFRKSENNNKNTMRDVKECRNPADRK